jgi:GTP-binding protein
MIIKSSEFIKSATAPSHYPEGDLPEIAFAGRSNVGKSSLINALLNRRHLVKTSSKPGHTRLVNFFLINNAFFFVDLPGYGYAKVPKDVSRQWGVMVEIYVSSRAALKCAVVIVDIRRDPGIEEKQLIDWLDHLGKPWIMVLTKADKFSRTRQKNRQACIAAELGVDEASLILFSSKTRQGCDRLWDAIQSTALQENS